MMGHAFRSAAYLRQTGSRSYTPAQRRRAQKKLGHFLARKEITKIRTIKGASK